MVLVDVKPSGLKAEAKIQWTAAQLIGCLLVCFFNVLSPQGLFGIQTCSGSPEVQGKFQQQW